MKNEFNQGEWLRSLIERSGYSNAAFARKAGISREALQRLFKQRRFEVRLSTAWKILRAAGLNDSAARLKYPSSGEVWEDRPGHAKVERLGAAAFFDNVILDVRSGRLRQAAKVDDDGSVELREVRPNAGVPTFDLAVAAGVWTEVLEVGELNDESEIAAGIFRICIRGDSMSKKWPNGSIVEFRCVRMGRDILTAGDDYYVQVGNIATFKRLTAIHDEELVFAAINKRAFPDPIIAARREIVRMARAEWLLVKPK
jgi:transcriptional regulator with XRE-family HTH domain